MTANLCNGKKAKKCDIKIISFFNKATKDDKFGKKAKNWVCMSFLQSLCAGKDELLHVGSFFFKKILKLQIGF